MRMCVCVCVCARVYVRARLRVFVGDKRMRFKAVAIACTIETYGMRLLGKGRKNCNGRWNWEIRNNQKEENMDVSYKTSE